MPTNEERADRARQILADDDEGKVGEDAEVEVTEVGDPRGWHGPVPERGPEPE